MKSNSPLMAAEAYYFCRNKSNKSAFSRNAFLPHIAFTLQIGQNLGCKSFARYTLYDLLTFMAKVYYALQPHLPTIVLPDFAQSCSAELRKNKIQKR